MSEEKVYSFGDSAMGRSTLDPNLLLATMNNGGGFGGNGNWMWIIFLFFLGGWGRGFGGNGFGGDNGYGNELLSQAISGNRTALSELASNLNCSVAQVQNAINAAQSSVQQVGNQVGMTGQQVINAIQQGNCTIATQLSNCCCELKDSITKQGYENQLATLNQTNTLAGKIDAQTTFLSDKFCELEKRELQNRIDALRESNTALKTQIDNANQTAQITGYINQLVSPIAQEVAGIKCKLPEVVNVPYSPVVGVPSCVAYQAGLYGNNFGFPFGNNGNGIFG